MSYLRCPNCELSNFSTDPFCRRCGTNLAEPQTASSPGLQHPAGNMAVQYESPAPLAQRSSRSGIMYWIMAAVIVVACLSVVGSVVIWEKYTHISWEGCRSSTGRYSVLMPGHPRKNVVYLHPFESGLAVEMTHVERPGLWACLAMYTEYPAVVNSDPVDKILEEGIRAAGTSVEPTIISRKKISTDKYEGIEFDMLSNDLRVPAGSHMIGRVYWIPPKAYILMVIGRPGSPLLKNRDYFFNSFLVY